MGVAIKELCSRICSGGTPLSTHAAFYDGDIPWLNTKEIDFNFINSTERTISQSGLENSSAKWVEAPAVIVAMYGATAGKSAISNIRLTTNQACCNLNINPALADYRFVFYSLKNDYNKLASLANGGAQQNLSAQQVKDFEVPSFSLPEQRKIAAILSSLDDKIETNRAINARLEELAAAIFKSWFIDFEPFADGEFIKDEHGRRPKDWKYRRIGDFDCTIETGRRPKGGVNGIQNGIPSIGAESIKGIGYYDYIKTKYISPEFASTLKRGKIRDYDLLIYKDGGKPGYFIPDFSIMGEGFPFDEMYLNEHVFRLDLGNPARNIFSYFYMHTDKVKNYLNSVGGKAAIPGINQKNVEDIQILDLDNEFVLKFGESIFPIFKSILQNCKENARLSSLRDALLPRLMSGEIKVQ